VTAGTAEVVITTKLFRPGLRQQTVERKRLYDLLREGRTLPLTLVVNPDGTTTAWNKNKTKVLHSHGPPARAG